MSFYFLRGKINGNFTQMEIVAVTHDKHNEESLILFLQVVSKVFIICAFTCSDTFINCYGA